MYLIYEQHSTRFMSRECKRYYQEAAYKTYAAAQAALTRMQKKYLKAHVDAAGGPLFTAAIAEAEYYSKNIERFVTRKNMMSGKEYTESVNTPNYMSPASEAYWSM